MTQLTVQQMAVVKRTAQSVLPLTKKKAGLYEKIAQIKQEIEKLNEAIDVQQPYIKSIANGLTSEQLVMRNEKKAFVPNPEYVYFDEETRLYVIKEKEATPENDDNMDGALPSTKELDDAEAAAAMAEAEAEAAETANMFAEPNPGEGDDNDEDNNDEDNNDPFAPEE